MTDSSGANNSGTMGGQCNLKGAVLDPDGKPLAGIKVSVSTSNNQQNSCTTDANGQFCVSRIQVPSGSGDQYTCSVCANLPGDFTPSKIDVPLTSADADRDLTAGNFTRKS